MLRYISIRLLYMVPVLVFYSEWSEESLLLIKGIQEPDELAA